MIKRRGGRCRHKQYKRNLYIKPEKCRMIWRIEIKAR
jgi:hypothetical protein